MCEVFSGWSRARWCWWISNTLNICQVVEPWMRYSQWEQTLLSSLLLSALWTRSSYACVCTEKGTIVYFPSEHIGTHTHKLFSVCNLVIAELQHEQAVKRFEWKNNLNRQPRIRTQTTRTTSVSHLACLICNVWLPPPLISHVGVQDYRLQDAKLCSVTKRISPGDSMELIQDPHFCVKRRLPLLPPRPSSRKTTPLFHIPAGQRTEWWIYINVTHLIWCCLTSP